MNALSRQEWHQHIMGVRCWARTLGVGVGKRTSTWATGRLEQAMKASTTTTVLGGLFARRNRIDLLTCRFLGIGSGPVFGYSGQRLNTRAVKRFQSSLVSSNTADKERELRSNSSLMSTASRPRRRRPMRATIELTDGAVRRIQEIMAQNPEAVGVRLGVKRRGCNGYTYTLNFVLQPPAKDEEIVREGVRLFVDPSASLFLAGTIMDWSETELRSEFVFTNPNAASKCGCGESFNVLNKKEYK